MIKEDKVSISVNFRNYKKYKELGYDIKLSLITDKVNIDVPIVDVNKTSKVKITAICDICGGESSLSIAKYWINFEREGYNFYSCFGCKNKKKEFTNIKTYGVRSFSQTDEFKFKYKETCLDRFGVDNPNKNKEFRDRIKKTNLENCGYVTHLLIPENIEKNRQWMSSDEFKEKSKESLILKYGVDSFSKTDEFKRIIESKKEIIVAKIRQTFLEKYGVDSISKTEEWKIKYNNKILETREKSMATCIERYGVDNVSKDKEIYNRILNTKIKNGKIIPDDQLSEWNLYKRRVSKITNRFKKQLFEDWDGNDYYDGEFIKGYLSYSHVHRFYPTIDHKISTMFGFINDIPFDEIGDMSNICITKRFINSMKNSMIEKDFITFYLNI